MQKREETIMKILITLLISTLSLGAFAQNINITFAGANSNRNYQVVLDGASYYSTNTTASNGNTNNNDRAYSRNTISIPNLSAGAHTIDVYLMGNNSTTYSNGSMNNPVDGESIYNKTFYTRSGYDMNITVRPNGLVSFTEKKATNLNNSGSAYRVPMSSSAFNQLYQKVRTQRYQSQKISLVKTALNSTANNFTTTQVRQLLLLINSERSRLDLAKLSYARVTDIDQFTSLYDVLNSEANRDALDEYVISKGGTASVNDSNAAYGTHTAMSTSSFNQLLQKVQYYTYQNDRIVELRNAFNNSYNYFTTAQLRQLLPLITTESERLSLVKLAYSHTTDQASFNQLVDLFYTQSNRDALNSFIVSNGGVANNSNANYRAPMADAAFNQIYSKARNHFLPWDVVRDVKNAFTTTSNNFSTEQIKQLLMLVASEGDKLALAKLAYPRAVDPLNFSQLLDLFPTQANRTELDAFIKSQQ